MRQPTAACTPSTQPVSAFKLNIAGCLPAVVNDRVWRASTGIRPAQHVLYDVRSHSKQPSRTTRLQCSAPAAAAEPSDDQQWQWKISTLRRMLAFMGPALVIPLGDPLMSLTDTVFIGQCAGTRELAAMGPANIVFSFSQYIFQALQIAAIRYEGSFMCDICCTTLQEVPSILFHTSHLNSRWTARAAVNSSGQGNTQRCLVAGFM
eukprot:GHUV01012386.1.p1 GENE.GHUV01012386.1~~GHUV01012386.1.p1  ORF type:complete len:206 (+),score=32.19 GHUV01012386.1:195-812(+)